MSNGKNNEQFEQIDQISNRINKIIKSISHSSHKKVDISASKTCRLQRSETTSKLNKLHTKYDNTSHCKKV